MKRRADAVNKDLNKPKNLVWLARNSGGVSFKIYIKTRNDEECNKNGGG